MSRYRRKWLAVAGFMAGIVLSETVRADAPEYHRVQAVILSSESSVRTSMRNRDSYIAEVIPRHGSHFLARLVDDYPAYREPLPKWISTGQATFTVELKRAEYCDDQKAVGGTENEAAPGMRCFVPLHGSWKSLANQRDSWWK